MSTYHKYGMEGNPTDTAVLAYIEQHLLPKTEEKHKFGEVFTPMSMVNEMLDTLPPSVWNDPTLKWLDPANGMGNFPIAAYLRLFNGFRTTNAGQFVGLMPNDQGLGQGQHYNPGLTLVLPDEDSRRKHIVENMLFMVELNPKNIAISKTLFQKLAPNVDPNIIQMDKTNGFLAEDVTMKFPHGIVSEFDIILGNPPYNRGGISSPDTRKRSKQIQSPPPRLGQKKETIWDKFVLQSMTKLKENGHLLFIHPIGWFHPGKYDPVRDLLLSRQIHILRIYKYSQSVKEFSGSGKITTAYYLMENTPIYKKTTIQGTLGQREQMKLHANSILLLNHSSIMSKLMSKSSFWENNANFKHTTVPCTPGANKQVAGIYENGEIHIVGTQEQHVDRWKKKLIISGRNYPRVYFDQGDYGLVGSEVNYWVGNKLSMIRDFLKTKLAAFLTKELKFRQNFVEYRYFPDITHPSPKMTDAWLAHYFNFSAEEQNVIQATEYPRRSYTLKDTSCGKTRRRVRNDSNE